MEFLIKSLRMVSYSTVCTVFKWSDFKTHWNPQKSHLNKTSSIIYALFTHTAFLTGLYRMYFSLLACLLHEKKSRGNVPQDLKKKCTSPLCWDQVWQVISGKWKMCLSYVQMNVIVIMEISIQSISNMHKHYNNMRYAQREKTVHNIYVHKHNIWKLLLSKTKHHR